MKTACIIFLLMLSSISDAHSQTVPEWGGKNNGPTLLAMSCANGAIGAAFVLAPEKITGDLDKDTDLIFDASKGVCTLPLVNAYMLENKLHDREGMETAISKTSALYKLFVNTGIKKLKPSVYK